MAFPQQILDTRVELLLGSTWTNVTSYVYGRDKVTISGGHPDEASRANPTAANLTLDNRTGRFAPRNPLGAYYGTIGRNTPMRISVPEGATYLRSETDTSSGASTPSSSGLNITGDIEVQFDASLENWYSGATFLCGKYLRGTNQRSWELSVVTGGQQLDFGWSTDGTVATVQHAVSDPLTTVPNAPTWRLAVKVTLSVATGTVTFYTAPTIAGPWTQAGTQQVLGATSIFASTAAVAVGYDVDGLVSGFQGKIHAFKVLSGIGGTVKASPDFTAQSAGATSFTDAQGNLWSVAGTSEISGRKYRFHGEVPAWPQKWDKSQSDIYAPVQASGLLRRLGLPGAPTLHSALYRSNVRATGVSTPLAYWPCEDGANATAIASALTGGSPMSIVGTPTFASSTSFPCSAPLPLISKSTWSGTAPAYAGTPSANAVQFLLGVPSTGAVNGAVLLRMLTTGTVRRLDVLYGTGGTLQLVGYGATGAQLFAGVAATVGTDGTQIAAQVSLETSGSNVNYVIWWYNLAGTGSSTGQLATLTTASIGQVTSVVVNPGGTIDNTAVGHIAVLRDASIFPSYVLGVSPYRAWIGERAAARFTRLCTEEGIVSRTPGDASSTAAMGAQTSQTLLALLQECEDADRGLIYEPRNVLALGYRSRASLYNQPAAAALSYSGAQLAQELVPQDDDLLTLNDVTVQRSNGGSSVRQTLATGAMSTQAPPNGVGPYPTSPLLNLAADTQLADTAGWILHTGTVDEPRYPGITVDLARSQVSGVYYAAQDVGIGDRVTVSGTPAFLPPDGISQLVRAFVEVCYGYTFTIKWLCSPESPYRVAVLDDTVLGHADTDGSTVHAGITSSAVSMQVDTTTAGSPLWTTAAGDFPFDIAVGGERMTVTNITGSSSPQTFTVTRSVNSVVKAQTAGTDVRLFQPMILSL